MFSLESAVDALDSAPSRVPAVHPGAVPLLWVVAVGAAPPGMWRWSCVESGAKCGRCFFAAVCVCLAVVVTIVRARTASLPTLPTQTMSQHAGPEYDYLFKLLLIGDSGVGKVCTRVPLLLFWLLPAANVAALASRWPPSLGGSCGRLVGVPVCREPCCTVP